MGHPKRKIETLTLDEVRARVNKPRAGASRIKPNSRYYLHLIPDVLKEINLVLTPCPKCGAPTIDLTKYQCKYCKYHEINT